MSNIVINPYNFAVAADFGSWKELGRTTLGAESDLISVTGLPNKRYYMLQYVLPKVSAANTRWTFNATTGSEYSARYTNNGLADTTFINGVNFYTHVRTDGFNYGVSYISNLSTEEKLCMFYETGGDGSAASYPDRSETTAKWANTSNSISSIQLKNTDGGGFDTGSELVVLGYDPTDTHTDTDNFWQELASVELGSSNGTLDSGTFTAKKYLWVQVYLNATAAVEQRMRFNSDSTSSYSFRYSSNGATDVTAVNDSNALVGTGGVSTPTFTNMFIVNNSANEKLVISQNVYQSSAGAASDPDTFAAVNKWVNTSSQITSIQLINLSGGVYEAGSIIKVWGSD